MIQIIEKICFVLMILSGGCLFVIFKIYPNVNITPPFSKIDILKIVLSGIFVASGIIEFSLQLVEAVFS